MIERRPHARHRSHQYAPSGSLVVETTAIQAFEGLPVGRENRFPPCIECGERLAVGEDIEVYVYRPIGRLAWSVGHSRCEQCRQGTITVTTLGVREILLKAKLGDQSAEDSEKRSQPVLVAIEPVAVSSPRHGEDSNLP